MKKEDAKHGIIELWLSRPIEKRTSPYTMIFYTELLKERPDLLNFRIKSIQDKYQIVNAFIWKHVEQKNI